ncbi:hypothetical protein BKA61DRAFT_738760 [Leptodontidium sp. MPI-SDFR-AT-0119]|nr:hypothetical protein BKA61DRAFT_719588 [Leptodontidium sp. MPI-SDFR-AT-0119]KAH6708885.1 hypothetical protein BKA61DRAFT_738760 [Leptodontidium sp. MPI-SDFR-AT-0119]
MFRVLFNPSVLGGRKMLSIPSRLRSVKLSSDLDWPISILRQSRYLSTDARDKIPATVTLTRHPLYFCRATSCLANASQQSTVSYSTQAGFRPLTSEPSLPESSHQSFDASPHTRQFSIRPAREILPATLPNVQRPYSEYIVPTMQELLEKLSHLDLFKMTTSQVAIYDDYLNEYSFPEDPECHIDIGHGLKIAIDEIYGRSLQPTLGPSRGSTSPLNVRMYRFWIHLQPNSEAASADIPYSVLGLVLGRIVLSESQFTYWVVAIDHKGCLWAFHTKDVDVEESNRWVKDEEEAMYDDDDDTLETPPTYSKMPELFGSDYSPVVKLGPLATVLSGKRVLDPVVLSGVHSWECHWEPQPPCKPEHPPIVLRCR